MDFVQSRNFIRGAARVVAADSRTVWVEAENTSTCGGCAASKTCGVSVLSGFFGRKAPRLSLPNEFAARVGERVLIGIPHGTLLKASAAVYLVPILAMAVGAVAGGALGGSDGVAALGAMAGLAGGFALSRGLGRSPLMAGALRPVFLGRAEAITASDCTMK